MGLSGPDEGDTARGTAVTDTQQQQLAKRLMVCTRAIRSDRKNALRWVELGDLLEDLGRGWPARKAYARAYSLEPELLSFWTMPRVDLWRLRRDHWEQFFIELGRLITIGLALNDHLYFEPAARLFRHLAVLEPGWWALPMYEAMALSNLGHYEEALVATERAIQCEPLETWLWGHKAHLLRRLGRAEAARKADLRAEQLRKPAKVLTWRPRVPSKRLDT